MHCYHSFRIDRSRCEKLQVIVFMNGRFQDSMALFTFLVPRHLLFNFATPNPPFEDALGHNVDYEYLAILPVPP
jgi:hypothetical protein